MQILTPLGIIHIRQLSKIGHIRHSNKYNETFDIVNNHSNGIRPIQSNNKPTSERVSSSGSSSRSTKREKSHWIASVTLIVLHILVNSANFSFLNK